MTIYIYGNNCTVYLNDSIGLSFTGNMIQYFAPYVFSYITNFTASFDPTIKSYACLQNSNLLQTGAAILIRVKNFYSYNQYCSSICFLNVNSALDAIIEDSYFFNTYTGSGNMLAVVTGGNNVLKFRNLTVLMKTKWRK